MNAQGIMTNNRGQNFTTKSLVKRTTGDKTKRNIAREVVRLSFQYEAISHVFSVDVNRVVSG